MLGQYPIQEILDHTSIRWAARACRTGDPHIRRLLEAPPAAGYPRWHDGTTATTSRQDTPISAAFHLTPICSPEEISYGNLTDCKEANSDLLHIKLIEPGSEASKEKYLWAAHLGRLRKDGWELAYSDGTGREGQAAAAFFTNRNQGGSFLGDLASVADAEREGLCLALRKTRDSPKVCILTDSTTAIQTALNLARGQPPRSGIEVELKREIGNRPNPTAIAWTRSHIGLHGNTQADELAALHSHLGVVSMTPRRATQEGIRNR